MEDILREIREIKELIVNKLYPTRKDATLQLPEHVKKEIYKNITRFAEEVGVSKQRMQIILNQKWVRPETYEKIVSTYRGLSNKTVDN